jgi:uncharacterized protein YqgV (UPF0045/DUF77 family)
MLFNISLIPFSESESILMPVTDLVQRIEDAGLDYEVNSASTVVEGEWEEVMPVLGAAEAALRTHYSRIFMLITVDDHEGRMNRLYRSADDVEERLVHAAELS